VSCFTSVLLFLVGLELSDSRIVALDGKTVKASACNKRKDCAWNEGCMVKVPGLINS